MVSGVKVFSITQGILKNAFVWIPPQNEQQAIVSFLDKKLAHIDTLISKQQQLVETLVEQRTAIISHAVTKGLDPNATMKDSGVAWLGEVPEGWEVKKKKYLFYFSRGLTITKANLQEEGIPCVNYGEVHSKYGFEVNPDIHPLKYVSEMYLKSHSYALLGKGDFVYADTSEDYEGAGNFTYLNSETPTFAGYHTVIERQIYNYSSRFFAYVFDSENFRNQIKNMVSGVKVFSVTQGILKNAFVWLPPQIEQQVITDYLDQETAKIDQMTLASKQMIEKLQEYRSALITQAVTGKIDVRQLDTEKNSEQGI